MLKRVAVAVVEGALVGGGVAGAVAALGLSWTEVHVVYGAALMTGLAIGLVAGKPPWAHGGKTEALLKCVVGVFIATAAVYGARKWLGGQSFALGPLGSGSPGELPRVLLPVVASAIAILLEIDDAVGPHATAGRPPPRAEGDAGQDGS